MRYPFKNLISATLTVVALLGGVAVSQATLIAPSSYDMPNGYGTSVGGEYNYWDTTYTGLGNKTADGAPLTGGTGKLTDGVIAAHSWEWNDADGLPHTESSLLGDGPYVGWTWGDPTITFHFADLVDIDTITFYVDDPANDRYGNPRGGVAAPENFIIGGSTYAVNSPSPGTGPLAVRFAELDLQDIEDLTVTLDREVSASMFWVFMSEVTFDDGRNPAPVPEPSSLLLVAMGGVALSFLRYRRGN
ncbi:MAG TPA: PEP-CTERM sorting domain-containing protein [Geobacter sp.]|nr:PEP-CTERM sorting domain-containing protein [Geobacter sp.]